VKRALGLLAAVLLVPVTACTGGSKHAPSTGRSRISAPPPPSTARLSTIATPPSSPTPTDALTRSVVAALVTAQDLPAGFAELPYTETALPQPCPGAGSKPVLSQVPPKARAGRQFLLTSPEAVLTEDVFVLGSAKDAARLVTVTTNGLACSNGTFQLADGSQQSVTLQGPQDITSVVGVTGFGVSSWTMQNGKLSVSFVLAQDHQVVAALTFLVSSTSDLSKLPQGTGPGIARTALTKIDAAGLLK
jgi:hypothetical protein